MTISSRGAAMRPQKDTPYRAERPVAPVESSPATLRTFLQRVLNEQQGRAVTTSELRHRARDAGFTAAQQESVYRHLCTLQRRGEVHRVGSRGRHVYWANTELGHIRRLA